MANARIEFWGYRGSADNQHNRRSLLVLGRRLQVDRGSRLLAGPMLTKRQGEQPRCSADQGEQYWCSADARHNRGSLLVLGRRSHANRGSSAHKLVLIGGAAWCSANAQVTRGPLSAQPMLDSTQGASRCLTKDQSTRRAAQCSANAHFQSSFLIGGASWCSTDAHFDKAESLGARPTLILIRRSLLVLSRRSF